MLFKQRKERTKLNLPTQEHGNILNVFQKASQNEFYAKKSLKCKTFNKFSLKKYGISYRKFKRFLASSMYVVTVDTVRLQIILYYPPWGGLVSVAPSVHTPSLPLGVILPPNQTTGLTLLFSHLSRCHPFNQIHWQLNHTSLVVPILTSMSSG